MSLLLVVDVDNPLLLGRVSDSAADGRGQLGNWGQLSCFCNDINGESSIRGAERVVEHGAELVWTRDDLLNGNGPRPASWPSQLASWQPEREILETSGHDQRPG